MKRLLPLLLLTFGLSAQTPGNSSFVTVSGTEFLKNGKPYRYIGANYWYGPLLGSKKTGDRKRLLRELDEMKADGIDNLRVCVGADGGTYDFTVREPLQPTQGKYDADLLDGLDFFLSELEKRNMTAVLYLTNNWEWSGGMAQYLEWSGYGSIPNPNTDKTANWDEFMAFIPKFHSCQPCRKALDEHITFIIGRTNAYSKRKYTEDPAIMAWQVANEPRIFTKENEAAFTDWLNETVDLIDTLDPNHLISTGSEGSIGCYQDMDAFRRTHENPKIDYLTLHVWPKNWNWYDATDESGTLPIAMEKAAAYIQEHITVASGMKRPLVIEEFGLPRSGESLDASASAVSRNTFYELFFRTLLIQKKKKSVLAGVNFWGFGGEGKAKNEKGKWNIGDPYTADPPQEPQGLNSVFSSEKATLELIRTYNLRLGE